MPVALATNSFWLNKDSLRLDAAYYCGPGQKEARAFIESDIDKKELSSLTADGKLGIFFAGRFRRTYVEDSEFGYPFITGSGIVQSDPIRNCKYVSKKYTPLIDSLILHEGMILISRSGSVGNIAYVNKTLSDNLGSDDLIRITSNRRKIHSGYLFAFLSSKIGKALITKNIYGSVIKHIEDYHLYDIPIPILHENIMLKIHDLIEKAANLKFEADMMIHDCSETVAEQLPLVSNKTRQYETFSIRKSELGFSYAGYNNSIRIKKIKNHIIENGGYQLKSICENIFAPPLFKHIYLKNDNGYPFMTGGELQQERPIRYRFLSPLGVKDINDYVVKSGWVVLYKSGSIDGMIGTPFLIGKNLEGFCLSDHVIRVVPRKNMEDLLLWAFSFFKSIQGKMLLKGLATGSAVPFILPNRLEEIYIPAPRSEKELERVAETIRNASNYKNEAIGYESLAIELVEKEISKWLD